jgi:probable HAF family extracellular repeat protein
MDVNAAGVVVGYSRDGTLTYPWIWHGGAIERLGTASGRANAINNRGDIVGTADVNGSGLEVPVVWRNGTPVSLQVSRSGEATDVNERGQVVGSAVGPRGTGAFLWEEGSITWLGTLPGGGQSAATAINDRGDIVGTVLLGQGLRAVMWRKGQIVDLGLSGVTVPFENVSEAFGITNSGQVIGRVGQGSARNGVVWTPPPR